MIGLVCPAERLRAVSSRLIHITRGKMTKQKTQAPGLKNLRKSAQQRKIRLQQVILAVIGIVVIISMVLALAMKY